MSQPGEGGAQPSPHAPLTHLLSPPATNGPPTVEQRRDHLRRVLQHLMESRGMSLREAQVFIFQCLQARQQQQPLPSPSVFANGTAPQPPAPPLPPTQLGSARVPPTTATTTTPAAAPIDLSVLQDFPDEDFQDAVDDILYSTYRPKKLELGLPHPDPVVENASLAAVDPPDVRYQLAIDPAIIQAGLLSDLQLETVVMACQRHETLLGSGERAGYFLGDGAGMGKGRQLAGLVLENWAHNRRKAVWVSVSVDLRFDAERDLRDLGASHVAVHALHKLGYQHVTEPTGVMFCTYSALVARASDRKRRLDQLVDWCGGADFEGPLIFDEAHKAKNLFASGRAASKSGMAVLELQQRLPKARVVYCSATGASEPRHLGYMSRLGLWGPGSPFPKGFSSFLETVEGRGTGAMELVAIHLKQQGAFCSRMLSFEGCSFDITEATLTADMEATYNQCAGIWQRLTAEMAIKLKDGGGSSSSVRGGMDDGLDLDMAVEDEGEEKRGGGGGGAKDLWRYFWATHQRFFRELCVAYKVPVAVALARQALQEGKCVVVGLQSTGEARVKQMARDKGMQGLQDCMDVPKVTLDLMVRKLFNRPLPHHQPATHLQHDQPQAASSTRKGSAGKRKGKAKAPAKPKRRRRRSSQWSDEGEEEEEEEEEEYMGEEDEEEEKPRRMTWRGMQAADRRAPAMTPASEPAKVEAAAEEEGEGGAAKWAIVSSSTGGKTILRFRRQPSPTAGVEPGPSAAPEDAAPGFSPSVQGGGGMAEPPGVVEEEEEEEDVDLVDLDDLSFCSKAWALTDMDDDDDNNHNHLHDDGQQQHHDAQHHHDHHHHHNGHHEHHHHHHGHHDDHHDSSHHHHDSSHHHHHHHGHHHHDSSHHHHLGHHEVSEAHPHAFSSGDYLPQQPFSSSSYGHGHGMMTMEGPSSSSEAALLATPAQASDEAAAMVVEEGTMTQQEATQSGVLLNQAWSGSGLDHLGEEEEEEEEEGEAPPPPELSQDERIDLILEEIAALRLPGNPLDTLIQELGGPDHVAEMTGRGTQLVRDDRTGHVSLESRARNGVSLELQNVHEKDRFMAGDKLVAVISEAASSGISLQADRRVANRRRRVHIILQLPWAADRAVQQLGRTHRSNQETGPEYRLLISSAIPGEKRFAAAVARRLECMGALTQGDRRATGSAKGFQSFNLETKWGQKALDSVLDVLRGRSRASVPLEDLSDEDQAYTLARLGQQRAKAGLLGLSARELSAEVNFKTAARFWLADVGLGASEKEGGGGGVTSGGRAARQPKTDIGRFLNRLLGLQLSRQAKLFSFFTQTLEATIRQAKRDGDFDDGIMELKGRHVRFRDAPVPLCYDASSGLPTLLYAAEVDRGVSWDRAQQYLLDAVQRATQQQQTGDGRMMLDHDHKLGQREGIEPGPSSAVPLPHNGFYVPINSPPTGGRSNILLAISKADALGRTGAAKAFRVYRPATGEHELSAANLASRYRPVESVDAARAAWVQDYEQSAKHCMHHQPCRTGGPACEAGKRVRVVYVLSGVLLSVWSAIQNVFASQQAGGRAGAPKVIRVVETAPVDGKGPGDGAASGMQVLGILVPGPKLEALRLQLGAQGSART